MNSKMSRRTVARLLAAGLLAPAAARALAAGRGEDPPPLRLATYNIHHAEGDDGRLDLDRVADVVRGADVVAFQEVDVRFRERSRFEDQAAALGARLGFHVAFGGNLIEGNGAYGVALASRFPILDHRNLPLPRSPGREKAEPRGVLEASVDTPGRPTRVYVTHLAHDSPADRRLQVDRLREVVAAKAGPFVLMGDLNLRPESEDYAALLRPGADGVAPMVDAWARVGRDAGATIGLGGKSPGRIDYILVSPDLAAGLVEARVDAATRASDHQPLFATLRPPAP